MELIDNLLQFFTALLGFCLAGLSYRKNCGQAYFLLSCFYGCFALGALYWTLYLLLFSTTPQVFYVSEFGWISSAIFLRILQYTLSGREERQFRCRTAWLSLFVGIPLLVLYCTHGDILSNMIWCSLMMSISYSAIRGLFYVGTQTGDARRLRHFHIGVLCFVAAEYALWASGCFWQGDTPANPYFWFDILLTGAVFGLLPATRKAAEP